MFWPYLRDPDTLARPWACPGTPGLMHRIGGIEKEDGSGNISYDPANHERMVRLRAAKIAGIAADIPPVEVTGDVDDAELLVLGWGSTWGAIDGAMDRVRARGRRVAHAHLTHLNPFPADLGDVLRRYPKVVVPEMNLGQLSQAGPGRVPRRRPLDHQGAGHAVHRRRARTGASSTTSEGWSHDRRVDRTAADHAKDWASDQEVRWCPGCGDYSILTAVQMLMPDLGVRRENTVFISGIGCAARFPYYMNTYGMHTIHGRAPAIATGLAMARPDLDVWVVRGDGDALSIGGNHLIHALRRNVNLTILIFNNQIYGLTKGQYSPTSEVGKVTKSTPFGSLDHPFNPVSLALGAEATFVARTHDMDRDHMIETMRRAHDHKGAAVVEIFQNCNVFNDGAFEGSPARRSAPTCSSRCATASRSASAPTLDKCVVAEPDGRLRVADVAEVGEDRDPRARRVARPTPASPSPCPACRAGPYRADADRRVPGRRAGRVRGRDRTASSPPPVAQKGDGDLAAPAPQRRHLGRRGLKPAALGWRRPCCGRVLLR